MHKASSNGTTKPMTTDKSATVVVCGGGGFIGGHLVRRPAPKQGHTDVRAADVKPLEEWYQVVSRGRQPRARPEPQARLRPRRWTGRPSVYNLAANMGGMGFIENNKALCMLSVLINTHLLEAARDNKRRPLLLRLVGVRLQRRQADRRPRHRAQGGRRLPRAARGRVRLGEAVQRAHVPPLPRGFRHRDPRRPLPQRLRPATAPSRAAARRPPPPSAARWHRGQAADRREARSRSGATASRPGQLHVCRRLRRGHVDA